MDVGLTLFILTLYRDDFKHVERQAVLSLLWQLPQLLEKLILVNASDYVLV